MTGNPYRSRDPAETVSLIRPHLAALGISRVGCQTGLDMLGIPVWFAVTPNARAIVIAQGKGLTDADAQASAVMEAVERAIASQPSCPRRLASRNEIAAEGGIADPLDVLLSPHALPVAPDEPLEWAIGRDLVTGAAVHLPFEAVHLDRTLPAPRYWRSSDGLASGNTEEEAVLHALLERIERDAVTLWTVTPAARRAPAIDPAQLESPDVCGLMDRFAAAGLVLRLFEITTDVAIPCFVALLAPEAVLQEQPVRHVDLTLGAGAHLHPVGAALRAMTEAAQSRLTFIGGARDDVPADMFERSAPADLCALMRAPLAARPALDPADMPAAGERVDRVLARLRAVGLEEIYAVRMDDGRLPIAVVKVVVPGLENPPGARRQRFGPRALRQVLR